MDFTIEKGEFAVVVGPSGAGKTTVLNILGGMDTATSGNVWVDGENIACLLYTSILGVELPDVSRIPAVRFHDIKEIVSEKYGHKMRNPFDLEPEEEQLIGKYAKEEWGSDFVFVTHYPSKKRPFYAMDDPEDSKYTLSFDLLFKGLEITTGGQRIHDYQKLIEKIEARGMETDGMDQYLATFRHGMPPHGGIGIGLERLTMQLIGEDNVRETTLFPRDLSRLEPVSYTHLLIRKRIL